MRQRIAAGPFESRMGLSFQLRAAASAATRASSALAPALSRAALRAADRPGKERRRAVGGRRGASSSKRSW
jgi:hypothetical protein